MYVVLVLTRYKWISTFRDLPDSADGMLPAPISALNIGGAAPNLLTRWIALDQAGAELSNERVRAVRILGLFEIFLILSVAGPLFKITFMLAWQNPVKSPP